MNKKGFLGDGMVFAVMFLAFSIFFIILYLGLSKVNDSFQGLNISQDSKDLISGSTTKFKNVFDNFIATFLIGVCIALIISAFILRNHPVFAGLAIIIMVMIIGVSFYLSNSFHSFAASEGISTYAEQFRIIPLVMNNLPKIITGILIIFIIILFSKNKSSQVY